MDNTYDDEEENKSGSAKIIIAIVVVVILLIAGGVGFYFYNKNKAPVPDKSVGGPCPCVDGKSFCVDGVCWEVCQATKHCKDAGMIPRIGSKCDYTSCDKPQGAFVAGKSCPCTQGEFCYDLTNTCWEICKPTDKCTNANLIPRYANGGCDYSQC